MNSWKNISIWSLSPSAMAVLLSGCLAGENKTFFDYQKEVNDGGNDEPIIPDDPIPSGSPSPTPGASASPSPTASPSPSATPNPSATPVATALSTETFLAATSQVKKIDFLFVVDNSGSMEDNQQKLADGFEAFANSFYRRADLDICTAIITTDRYLGKTGNNGYQRERILPCTKPAGWSSLTAAQQNLYIDALIAEFKSKINVGINGSGTEFVGKSLVSYLYKLNSWGNTIAPSVRTSFFRADAVANISVVTDENNWFYNGNQTENKNDLPAVQNAAIYNSTNGSVDSRKGIKNYMDEFFAAAQPSHGLSYSISSFLETSKPATSLPGLAMNLTDLSSLVGRESAKTDIGGNAASYANLYQSIGDGIVLRASAFNVIHEIYEPLFPTLADLTVTIIKADSSRITLSLGSNYDVLMPNGIVLDSATSSTTSTGDRVEVHYRYDTAH